MLCDIFVSSDKYITWGKGMYNPSLKLAMDIATVFNKTVEEVFFFYGKK